MRVRVYVDGFNVYYRALKGTNHKWLDPLRLAQALLDPEDRIDVVRYFTARVSARGANTVAPARQQAYISALRTRPEIRIHYGRFLAKTKIRPLVSNPAQFVAVHDTEEKGSDVNLASYLLMDGWQDRYDAALVMSQDSDLCEPMRLVKLELKKAVGLVWLDGLEPGRRFRSVTSFVRHATPSRLANAQFPDTLMGRDGHLTRKPERW